MAFPIRDSVTPTAIEVAANSFDIQLPDPIFAGDLILITFALGGATTTITLPGDYVSLWNVAASPASAGFYKVADGSEGGTTVNVTTSGSARPMFAQVLQYHGWLGAGGVESGTIVLGEDPPTLTPSWGALDTTWIAWVTTGASDREVTVLPDDFTDAQKTENGAGNDKLVTTFRELNTTVQDPTTYDFSGATSARAQTIAIQPGSSGGPPTDPAISDVSPATVQDGTEIVIIGTTFEAVQGTGKVELGDNSVYGSATLVEATVSAWADTEITADVVRGALATGSVWVFVTNDTGNVSAGFEITLVEPTITSVTPDSFTDEDTGIAIAGTTFEAAQGTGKVELGDNATYGSANLQEQTETSWADTAIEFTAVLGSLTPGTLYVFVTNNSGNVSAGSEVTVAAVAPPSPSIVVEHRPGQSIGVRLEQIYAAIGGHTAPKASRSEYWLLGKIGALTGLDLTSGNKSLEQHLVTLNNWLEDNA